MSVPASVVAIGASAGGLKALTELFAHLPADTGMSFVVTQHLSLHHESLMAGILSRSTKMPVIEIVDGMKLEPNQIYVMSAKACISLSAGMLRVHAASEDPCMKMPIDYFFNSMAEEGLNKSIAVILSGAAADGSLGLIAVSEAGGITFAQDQDSAEYDSMPQNAVATGCVDFICSPREIAEKIAQISRCLHNEELKTETPSAWDSGDEDFQKILKTLGRICAVNFAGYKTPTLKRRVLRRMILKKSESLKDYAELLEKDSQEAQALSEDVLIHVTQFFRDPEMFEFLKNEIFPKLIEKRETGDTLRVWIAGCATGEEAYSVAIVLLEVLGSRTPDFGVQIFATDVKDSCIHAARKGIYKKGASFNVSDERLHRFFIKQGEDHYQISKPVRDICVFSKHNALTDPPYSKMDLVSCRNFLIYLNFEAQKKLLSVFHYALKSSGFLVLGQSESAAESLDQFCSRDKKIRVFSKIPGHPNHPSAHPAMTAGLEKIQLSKSPWGETYARDPQKEADQAILLKYEHAGVVVNEHMEILQFRGDTSPFLINSPGTPTTQLFKMIREDLGSELHRAIEEVKNKGLAVQKKGLRTNDRDDLRQVSLDVLPLKGASGPVFFLILFSMQPLEEALPHEPESRGGQKESPQAVRLRDLETELAAAKTYLRAIIEDRENANRELQSANEEARAASEEFQSINEELQSTNEELETAKEELQATNEEITAMNDELQHRIAQLTVLNDDLGNLLTSVHLPGIMVGKDLCVRRFTRMAGKVFHLGAKDVGRRLGELKVSSDFAGLEASVGEVMTSGLVKEQEVQDEKGRWYFMQIRAYKTGDHKIDGAIILLTDINELKKVNELLEIQQVKLEMSNQELEQFAYVASHDLREPLRIISMYLDLLQKRYQDRLDKTAEEYIKFAKTGAERSEEMIRDLLEYAKVGIKGKPPKVTDIEEVLKRALSNLELDVLESGAEITHDPLPQLMADNFQMIQLFQNLLSNALKYASKEPLKIHLSAERRDRNWLFSVKDNGIGIAPEHKEKVFMLFQRIPTRVKHPGTGIGLAICKKIVEHHGGKIWIESKQGEGATFFFTLPEKHDRR